MLVPSGQKSSILSLEMRPYRKVVRWDIRRYNAEVLVSLVVDTNPRKMLGLTVY